MLALKLEDEGRFRDGGASPSAVEAHTPSLFTTAGGGVSALDSGSVSESDSAETGSILMTKSGFVAQACVIVARASPGPSSVAGASLVVRGSDLTVSVSLFALACELMSSVSSVSRSLMGSDLFSISMSVAGSDLTITTVSFTLRWVLFKASPSHLLRGVALSATGLNHEATSLWLLVSVSV